MAVTVTSMRRTTSPEVWKGRPQMRGPPGTEGGRLASAKSASLRFHRRQEISRRRVARILWGVRWEGVLGSAKPKAWVSVAEGRGFTRSRVRLGVQERGPEVSGGGGVCGGTAVRRLTLGELGRENLENDQRIPEVAFQVTITTSPSALAGLTFDCAFPPSPARAVRLTECCPDIGPVERPLPGPVLDKLIRISRDE